MAISASLLHRSSILHSITMSSLVAIQKVDAMEDFIEALGADRAELIRICEGLDAAEWAAPSGCPAWWFKVVFAYRGPLFWRGVVRAVLPDISGLAPEAAQEVLVGSRRSLTAEQVLNDYATVSEKALTALADFAGR